VRVTSTTWETWPELPDGAPPPDRGPGWPMWMGFAAVPTALVLAMLGGLIVFLVAIPLGGQLDDPGPAENLGATFVQDIVFVATAIGLASMVSRPRPRDFGLRLPKFWPAAGWSLLTYVAIAIVGAVASAAFGVSERDQDNVLDDLGIKDGSAWVYVAAFVVCVMAPLCEELLFRGFVFPSLKPRLGLITAALVSGAIFGGIHITNYIGEPAKVAAASVITLITLGTLFALLYWKTGSLLPCITLHAINNSVAFGVMQDWSWEIVVLIAASLALCALAVFLATRFWRVPTLARA
jgi:membrane protease YdiL (CAAX protease family)